MHLTIRCPLAYKPLGSNLSYIEALERLRLLVDVEPLPFYLDLLRAPIKQRPALALGLGRSLPTIRKAEYIRAFSASNAVLRTMLDRLQ